MNADERSRYSADIGDWKKLDMDEFADPVLGQIYWRTVGNNIKVRLVYAGTEGDAVIVGAATMDIEQKRTSFRTKVKELVIQFKRAGVYGIIPAESRYTALTLTNQQQLKHESKMRERAKRDAADRARREQIAAEEKMKVDQEESERRQRKLKRLASIAEKQESKSIGGPKWHEKLWETGPKLAKSMMGE
jgi:predicted thioesterase